MSRIIATERVELAPGDNGGRDDSLHMLGLSTSEQ